MPAGPGGASFQIYQSVLPVKYVQVPSFYPVYAKPPLSDTPSLVGWFTNTSTAQVPLALSPLPKINLTATNASSVPIVPIVSNCSINESIQQEVIDFNTSCVGLPHMIKVTYDPRWQVAAGAAGLVQATPNDLLVYPTATHVKLVFEPSNYGLAGGLLSCLGLLAAIAFGAGLLAV